MIALIPQYACRYHTISLSLHYIDGCNDPIPPDNAVPHNASESMSVAVIAPGEVITFICRFASGVYVHILCQESGLWYPDPSTVLCPSKSR